MDLSNLNESKEAIKNALFGDDSYIQDLTKEEAEAYINDVVQDFLNELPSEGNYTVFYIPDYNYMVDYYVSEESTGYSEDNNYYKVGLLITEKQ